ncbi:MAG: hypothetical protein EXS50_01755 [Candidatus Taylorbacteria bacterium]|nr:hypothetical protein [Candidatus Taylorbacteria bacterium]
MKNFSLKFLDIMVGMVLGLGFQWWPVLQHPWQYLAFIFVYIDIVDFWMDYGPSLKKFPPKREIDVILDVAIMFALFLYIYSTQLDIKYLFGAFTVTRIFDFFWMLSSKYEYRPAGLDGKYLDTWLVFDVVEGVIGGCLILASMFTTVSPLTLLLTFIGFRIVVRVLASRQYKKIHFV